LGSTTRRDVAPASASGAPERRAAPPSTVVRHCTCARRARDHRSEHHTPRDAPPRHVKLPHSPRRLTPSCPPVRPLFHPVHARLLRLAVVPRCKWPGIPSRQRHCPLQLARRDYKTALPFSCCAHASVALPSSLPWCTHPSASFRRRPTPPTALLAPNRARTAACCPWRACRSPDIMPPRPMTPGSAAQPRRRHHGPNSGHNRALGELVHLPHLLSGRECRRNHRNFGEPPPAHSQGSNCKGFILSKGLVAN
jgi:hypothetical protein